MTKGRYAVRSKSKAEAEAVLALERGRSERLAATAARVPGLERQVANLTMELKRLRDDTSDVVGLLKMQQFFTSVCKQRDESMLREAKLEAETWGTLDAIQDVCVEVYWGMLTDPHEIVTQIFGVITDAGPSFQHTFRRDMRGMRKHPPKNGGQHAREKAREQERKAAKRAAWMKRKLEALEDVKKESEKVARDLNMLMEQGST